MLEDNIETILGKKYSKDFLSNGSNYSKTLKKDGIIVFNNFININGLRILKNEAKKLS